MKYGKRKHGKKITQKPQCHTLQCKRGRDNKDYYNSDGWMWGNRWATRVPSLKAKKKEWENFYKLFPRIKSRLMNPDNYDPDDPNRLILEGDVIVERLIRYRTVNNKAVATVKTRKYKKIW